MYLSQVKKSRKSNQHFSKEQNEFLLNTVPDFIQIDSEREKWKKIFDVFVEKSPNCQTKVKNLKDHYNNVLNPELSKILSKQEKILVSNLFKEKGFKHRAIAKAMKKTETCIKNYCHTEFRKKIGEVQFQKIRNIGKKKNETLPQVRSNEKNSIDSNIDEIHDACLHLEENHFLDYEFFEPIFDEEKIKVFEEEVNKLLIQRRVERNLMSQQESFFQRNHEFPS
jgi:predicted transcriptional regulator